MAERLTAAADDCRVASAVFVLVDVTTATDRATAVRARPASALMHARFVDQFLRTTNDLIAGHFGTKH